MSAKKTFSSSVATLSYETQFYSLSISNENGVHTHKRNGERFKGKQEECPICENGSDLEKAVARIGI